MHAQWQTGGVPEEAEIGRSITTFLFFTCALGAPMSDYPRDAVSAAEPLRTHVKDHLGLGPPNSLKSHLFKMNHLKVNFGPLRDPSFLAARMGAVTYSFVF